MTQTLDIAAPAYRAALDGAALADESAAGRIFMRGRERAALLHRLSSNNIERLKPGQGAHTVLTTPIGRIIDLLTVHATDDSLLVVTSPGQGGPVWAHLKKNIFFNDQVTLESAGRSHGQLALYGPDATRVLEAAFGAAVGNLPLHHTASIEINGATIIIARREPIGGPSFTLYLPADQLDAARVALSTAGASALDEATLDILRVERGYAVFGRELSQEYIPLETGLLDAVSFTKGCYVGQEIIARMESRNRLAKQLRGLRLTQPVAAPAKLEVGGKESGDLTSVVVSPRYGPIALAYVRSAHAEAGSIVGIAGADARGEVVELPFDKRV
jgi:folate-binding protein YgfZ